MVEAGSEFNFWGSAANSTAESLEKVPNEILTTPRYVQNLGPRNDLKIPSFRESRAASRRRRYYTGLVEHPSPLSELNEGQARRTLRNAKKRERESNKVFLSLKPIHRQCLLYVGCSKVGEKTVSEREKKSMTYTQFSLLMLLPVERAIRMRSN